MPSSRPSASAGARRRGRVTALALVLLLTTTACGVLSRSPDPVPVVQSFVDQLRRGTVSAGALADPAIAEEAQEQFDAIVTAMGTAPQFPLAGPVEVHPGADDAPTSATARVRVRWRLPAGTWAYDTSLPLLLAGDEWKVAWSATVLHPLLRDGGTLDVWWTTPRRGPILSADGEPLFRPIPVVTVHVQPRRVRNLDQVLDVLQETLDIEPGPLRERVEAADPDHLVEVITLRAEDYAPLRATLHPVPGLVFKLRDRPLTPYREFARALLGRLAPPTAEVLDEVGPGFEDVELLGVSGLQRQFQRRLAGRPGMRIVVIDEDGEEVDTVHKVDPVPGEALRTTLRPEMQTAADQALSDIETTAALVALDAGSGEVLAVANGPDGGEQNLAFTGRYPPGSAFAVVTAAALHGDPGDRADLAACRRDAAACGAALRQAGELVSADRLRTASSEFGFGGGWSPGVDAFDGELPETLDEADAAAGQGGVLVSPLLMATVAAAVADGTWHPPVLLPDHARPGDGSLRLNPDMVESVARMMRDTVVHGGAPELRDVPGAPVHAIVGSATDGATYGWTLAYRDDIAVAVLVEGDPSAPTRAAGAAADFFRAL